MAKQDIIDRLLNPGVIAIMRADNSEQLLDAARAMADGGVVAMEVTMTTPNAIEVIKAVTKELGDQVLMGVGSIIDDVTARLAMLAGAEYVVTPVMRQDVIALCRRYGKPIICGAYTPTEMLAAYESGADFIKLFPADGLGVSYVKAIRAPLPQLQIIPTGGVTPANCGEFIQAGCPAVAAGNSLIGKDVLKNRDWKRVTEMSRTFVAAVQAARVG